jgi:hypothetical protein
MAETLKRVNFLGTGTQEMYNTLKFCQMTLSFNATGQGSRNLQLSLNLATSSTLKNKIKESKVESTSFPPKKTSLIFLSKMNPNTKKTFYKNFDIST